MHDGDASWGEFNASTLGYLTVGDFRLHMVNVVLNISISGF